MNKIFAIIVIVISFSVFTSCEKDIKINDDYKDITIVYGLIDPTDSVSYLRIEKAFLSDGDIYQAAQIPDSNLYSYKLDVKLYNEAGNEVVVFDTITIYNKEEGVFYAPVMQVYYAVTKGILNDDESYRLEINNPKTGTQISSSARLIDGSKMRIDKPNYNIDFERDQDVEFESKLDVRLYQVNIRFHYIEENIFTGDSTRHYVNWIQSSLTSQFLTGGEELKSPYVGDAFYANLEANIPIKDDVIRREGDVEIILSIADETFNLYMEINKPSASLVIDRPEFTNIENGFGIFASRSKTNKLVKLNARSHRILIEMEDLNFQESD